MTKALKFLLVIGLASIVSACGSSKAENSSAPASTGSSWSQAELASLTKECIDSESGISKAMCDCLTTEISSTYSDTEWKAVVEQMDQTGVATNAYMKIWSGCENKFGSAGSNEPDGPSQNQTQNSYPPCVQVLAPGNSGLSINDNQRELGRADGKPGYCILPNSGGEKYYYRGR